MSPDERAVATLIAAARRRAAVLTSIEYAAWTAAAAMVAVMLERAVGASARIVMATVTVMGFAGGIALLASIRPRSSSRTVLRALERADGSAKNVLLTAGELLDGTLAAGDSARSRVFAHASDAASRASLAAAFPSSRAAMAGAAGIISISAMLLVRTASAPSFTLRVAGTDPRSSAARGGIVITVRPPAYVRQPVRTETDPAEIRAMEGSEVTAAPIGQPETVLARVVARTTTYLAFDDRTGGRHAVPIVVTPDALPSAAITVPGRDLVRSDASGRFAVDVRATDDIGLRSLVLRYTKVSGSGEQFEFVDGEIPLQISRDNGRAWRGTAERALADFDLKEGDMLVYRAVAADERPGDGSSASDAFFIEISRLGVAAGDAFTLPEQETRYALSQQMLIVKTGRLEQQRASMADDALRDAALNLAVEQRMIRAEFVFMLGGEIEDEEVEAEQSTELQEGRLANRGQRDLRAATVAMSQAEKLLTAVDLPAALAAERSAVAALQRAFARDRYILRALASRTTLDPARRLSGDLGGARDWRRLPMPAESNRRAALLQDVLRGMGEAAALPGNEFERRARVLAEEALRIDPASARLRATAQSLQRAAAEMSLRADALAAAATAIADETRRSSSGAVPTLPPVSGALSGSFEDLRAATRARSGPR